MAKQQPESGTFALMQTYDCKTYKNNAVATLYVRTQLESDCKTPDGKPATGEFCFQNLIKDNRAAWSCAIQGFVKKDPALYEASAKIIRAWASKFKGIKGYLDTAPLHTSYSWHPMIWAADLLEATYPGFTASDRTTFRTMLRTVVLPVNSQRGLLNNWESWRVHSLYNVGIYLRDTAVINKAYADILKQIPHYLGKGYSFEVSRDMWHAQMGIAPLALAAEIAYHRGDGGGLYKASNNAILRASEHAAYIIVNLKDGDTDPVSGARNLKNVKGGPWPFYQMIVHHYGDRLRLNVNRSKAVVASNRYPRFYRNGVEDFARVGWGTAFYRGAF